MRQSMWPTYLSDDCVWHSYKVDKSYSQNICLTHDKMNVSPESVWYRIKPMWYLLMAYKPKYPRLWKQEYDLVWNNTVVNRYGAKEQVVTVDDCWYCHINFRWSSVDIQTGQQHFLCSSGLPRAMSWPHVVGLCDKLCWNYVAVSLIHWCGYINPWTTRYVFFKILYF